ncbi:MAG: hypothetical protein ACR2HG_13405 [Pyrinomonadaceae bacterium]
MQAVLNIKLNEIDEHLLNVIKELLSRNVEVVIKKESLELEKFDQSKSLEEVMREFEKVGYSENFLSDLKAGFKTSEIYAERNENKTSQR